MDNLASLLDSIHYLFKNNTYWSKLRLHRGAPTSDTSSPGEKEGNKRLALIGDGLIRLDIVERGYKHGICIGTKSGLDVGILLVFPKRFPGSSLYNSTRAQGFGLSIA